MPATTFDGGAAPRTDRLGAELRMALAETGREDLVAWGARSAARLPVSLGRRVICLARLAFRISKAVAVESTAALRAGARGTLDEHAKQRAVALVRGAREAFTQVGDVAAHLGRLVLALPRHPEQAAPELFGLGIGLLAGSGGLDGDGGIPDLDLAAGIGFHRSIFTHSIIAGAVAEALIAAALDLVLVVHARLPPAHDPLWEVLACAAVRGGASLRVGVDAGLALHLLVDGSVDGMTPYKDLPVPAPLAVHRALLLGNGAAEATIALDGGSLLAGKRR